VGVLLFTLLTPPHDYFCIGKEKSQYDKKQKTRHSIIWAVGIGFVVSFIAGLVLWIITNTVQ